MICHARRVTEDTRLFNAAVRRHVELEAQETHEIGSRHELVAKLLREPVDVLAKLLLVHGTFDERPRLHEPAMDDQASSARIHRPIDPANAMRDARIEDGQAVEARLDLL